MEAFNDAHPRTVCRAQNASTEITDAETPSFEVIRDIALTIRGLKGGISSMEPAVERETSTKEHLGKQLKDQRKEKDRDDITPQRPTSSLDRNKRDRNAYHRDHQKCGSGGVGNLSPYPRRSSDSGPSCPPNNRLRGRHDGVNHATNRLQREQYPRKIRITNKGSSNFFSHSSFSSFTNLPISFPHT